MIRIMLATALFTALAQSQPAFEVATVRPAAPLDFAKIEALQKSGGQLPLGPHVDASRALYTNMTMRELAANAWSMKPDQVTGPTGWTRHASIFSHKCRRARRHSFLMQDEPERGTGFSYKISLKGRIGMLGIDHQHGRFGANEPGTDSGVSGGKQRGAIRRSAPRGIYAWTEQTLVRHEYAGLSRAEKGVLRQYLARMTGLSRAQMTRLITSYAETGHVKAVTYQRSKFASVYTKADVELLAYVDKSHGNLSGPATKRILEREHSEYGQAAYGRLAGISVAQIYRFRSSEFYASAIPVISRPDPV
jgi:hypothetical protein